MSKNKYRKKNVEGKKIEKINVDEKDVEEMNKCCILLWR
jgi:hypothetical protein